MKRDKFDDLTTDQKLEFYTIANSYYLDLIKYQKGEISKSEFKAVIAKANHDLDAIERKESMWGWLKSLFQ